MVGLFKPKMTTSATFGLGKNCPHNKRTKLVVLYHHWSCLIWHEEEGFPSNVGLFKPKMTTSATLGLGKNCPHTYKTYTLSVRLCKIIIKVFFFFFFKFFLLLLFLI